MYVLFTNAIQYIRRKCNRIDRDKKVQTARLIARLRTVITLQKRYYKQYSQLQTWLQYFVYRTLSVEQLASIHSSIFQIPI